MTLRYIVMSRAEKMPSTCWGRYGKVAVVLTSMPTGEPKMISARARGVIAIIQEWRRLNVGSSERCAFARALVEAQALADQLNAELERKAAA